MQETVPLSELECERKPTRSRKEMDELISSIKYHGLETPLEVRGNTVVQGARRFHAITEIRDHDPDVFSELFPKTRIPCNVTM